MASVPDTRSPAYAQQLDALHCNFVEGLANRLQEMETAPSTADLHAALHRLVGAAGAYGYEELGHLARQAMNELPNDTAARRSTPHSNALAELKASIQHLQGRP